MGSSSALHIIIVILKVLRIEPKASCISGTVNVRHLQLSSDACLAHMRSGELHTCDTVMVILHSLYGMSKLQ